MNSEELVELALRSLKCSQKDLALRLGVSPTQISKWKKGEHLSYEMSEKLRTIANVGDKIPSFVLLAGSLDDANKWERLIGFLAETASGEAETGYDTAPLEDELVLLCAHTFDALKELGIELPKSFPEELDIDYDHADETQFGLLVEENPYSALIYRIFLSLNDVYGFYAAYVSGLIHDEDLELGGTAADDIEPHLVHLAACKTEVDETFAPHAAVFKRKLLGEYETWLTFVKDRAFRAGIPLRAELLRLVYKTSGELGHEAEAESLGFNSSRIHPDIYMNELLEGMRVLHQVLPAIMKKVGMENEFQLNSEDLYSK